MTELLLLDTNIVTGLPTPMAGDRAVRGSKICAMSVDRIIHIDPQILGGTPVFVGTRVPVKSLVDYLEGGHSLADFLEDFPSVTKTQAVAALEQAKELLLANARPA